MVQEKQNQTLIPFAFYYYFQCFNLKCVIFLLSVTHDAWIILGNIEGRVRKAQTKDS